MTEETYRQEELLKRIPDAFDYHKKDIINIIRLNSIHDHTTKDQGKRPFGKKWNENHVSLHELQIHDGNFGILAGYNHEKNGYSPTIIDVDGYKSDNPEIKKQTADDIYEILKALPNTIQVITANGGHHILIFNRKKIKDDHWLSKRLYFPLDYHIVELQGKPLGNAIEIFTGGIEEICNHQGVLAGSLVKNKNGEKTVYELAENSIHHFSEMNITNDVNADCKALLENAGYIFNEQTSNTPRFKEEYIYEHNKPENKTLNSEQINEVAKLVSDILTNCQKNNTSKHTMSLFIGGYFYYHISKESAQIIVDKIAEMPIAETFNSIPAFKSTIMQHYNGRADSIEIGGMGKIVEILKDFKNVDENYITKQLQMNCSNKPYYIEDTESQQIGQTEWNIIKHYWVQFLSLFENEYLEHRKRIKHNPHLERHLDKALRSIGASPLVCTGLFKASLEHLRPGEALEELFDEYIEEINTNQVPFFKPLYDRSEFGFAEDKNMIREEAEQFIQILNVFGGITHNVFNKLKEKKNRDVNLQLAFNRLCKQFNFKNTKDSINECGGYIYNDMSKKYEKINTGQFQAFISKRFNINGTLRSNCEEILKMGTSVEELDNSVLNLKNGYYNTDKKEFKPANDFREIFTIRCPRFNYIEDFKEKNVRLDEIIQGITIPHNNQEDTTIYRDFYERLGASYNTRNCHKAITWYYGKGNQGKDQLIQIIKKLFTGRAQVVSAAELKDGKAVIKGIDVLIINEVEVKDLQFTVNYLKNMTGGFKEGQDKRQYFSQDFITEENPSMIYLFGNDIPEIDTEEIAFFERVDFIELPNTFANNPKNDEVQADNTVQHHILKAAKDEEWDYIFNKAIHSYADKIKKEGINQFQFTRKQRADETINIINGYNPIDTFLDHNYEADTTMTCTAFSNRQICDQYEEYCLRNNIRCPTGRTLSVKMGNAITKRFGTKIKEKTKQGVVYYLIPLQVDRRTFITNEIQQIGWKTLSWEKREICQYITAHETEGITFTDVLEHYAPRNVKKDLDFLIREEYISLGEEAK